LAPAFREANIRPMHLGPSSRALRRVVVVGAFGAALCISPVVHAGPLSLLSKAAKVASGSGKAAKTAAGASKLKAAMLAGGAVTAAERSGLLFKAIPDDATRVAAYVASEPDGAFRIVTRAGEQATHPPGEVGLAVQRLGTEAKPVDLYLDLTAARSPGALPPPEAGRRWFVLDAHGKPHPVRTEASGDGTLQHTVDAGDVSLDLADFAAFELDREDDDEPPPWFFGLAGVVVVGGVWMVIRRRRRAKSEADKA
jgi:hypothetical protein